MATYILVNGNRIKEMDKDNFFSVTDIMKENSNMVKEKDSDHFFTKMEIYLMVCGIQIKNTDQEN